MQGEGRKNHTGARRRSGREGPGAKGGSAASRAASSEGSCAGCPRARGGRRGETGRRARTVQGSGEEGRNSGAGLRARQVSWSHITEQTVGDPISQRHHAPARDALSPSTPWQTRTQCWKENILTHTTEEGQNGQGKGSGQVGPRSLDAVVEQGGSSWIACTCGWKSEPRPFWRLEI